MRDLKQTQIGRLFQAIERQSPLAIGSCVFGIGVTGFLVLFQSPPWAPNLSGNAPVGVGDGVFRIEFDNPLVLFNRLLVTP
jgi:hypothetical protein